MSRELEIKSIRMKEYKEIYSEVETIVRDLSGGTTIHSYRELQKSAKDLLCLRTQRADWRTKQGIILWFCEHWKLIKEKFICEIKNRDLASATKPESFHISPYFARVNSDPEVLTVVIKKESEPTAITVKGKRCRVAKVIEEPIVVDEVNDADLFNEMYSDLNYFDFDQADCEVEDVDF